MRMYQLIWNLIITAIKYNTWNDVLEIEADNGYDDLGGIVSGVCGGATRITGWTNLENYPEDEIFYRVTDDSVNNSLGSKWDKVKKWLKD